MVVVVRESVSGKLLNFKHLKWLSDREDCAALRKRESFKAHKRITIVHKIYIPSELHTKHFC